MAQQGIVHWISTANAGIFLIHLPFRIWELRNSQSRVVPGAQTRIKLVGQHSLKLAYSIVVVLIDNVC